jgi:hypothetical protein
LEADPELRAKSAVLMQAIAAFTQKHP